jgi:hypothetical protein
MDFFFDHRDSLSYHYTDLRAQDIIKTSDIVDLFERVIVNEGICDSILTKVVLKETYSLY